MKFQNPSMHGSYVACIKKRDERTHMHARTDGRTDNPKPICPVNFFEVGGINSAPVSNFVFLIGLTVCSSCLFCVHIFLTVINFFLCISCIKPLAGRLFTQMFTR